MRGSAALIGLTLLAANAFAQGNTGAISGIIKDPDGGSVASAIVQAKHTASGKIFKMETGRSGSYTLSGLPAGTYDLWIPEVGFLLDGYNLKGIEVHAGEKLQRNIVLNWGNTGALGDDIYVAVHTRNLGKKLTGPLPRLPNGKPDFSGIWLGARDTQPEVAEALPWVDEVMKKRAENGFRDLPSADCLPGDLVPASPLTYKIVHIPTLMVQLFEYDPHFRQVYIDGRPHPKDLDPTWTGHSIAKWEGDTLVIDTVGFNDKTWLPNLMPHTEKMHIVERYSRPDLAHLTVHITFDDPGTFKKPWNIRMVWELTPDEEVPETICTENNHFRELTGNK
jgi:hypothetical protein